MIRWVWVSAALLAALTGLVVMSAVQSVQQAATGTSVLALAGGLVSSGDAGVCEPGGQGIDAAAHAALAAGWAPADAVVAVAIAGAESGWDAEAVNVNTDGSVDRGMWQINSVHDALWAGRDWRNVTANAQVAHQVWARAGHSFSPWVTYQQGLHVPEMGAAEAAVRRAGGHVAQIEVVCGGGVFTDPNMPGTVTNPRSAAQAIAWARAQVAGPLVWQYRCLNFVARAYGHTHSGATAADGTAYAINLFRLLPDAVKSTDRDPPPGALVYWETGNPAGHVALYLGGGLVASTDILRDGGVDVVAFTDLERLWGARYVGWSIPEFPNA